MVRGFLRRIPLGTRILAANVVMVIVPIALLAALGALLYGAFALLGGTHLGEVSQLFPKHGPLMATKYALAEISDELEDKEPETDEIATLARTIEMQGGAVAAFSGGAVQYVSPGADAAAMRREMERTVPQGTLLQLSEERMFYVFHGKRGAALFARGDLRMPPGGKEIAHAFWTGARYAAYILIAATIVLIAFLGRFVARNLTRQILRPLDEIRRAAAEISRGNLKHPLALPAREDELWQACRDIEKMRRDLLAAREERERYEANRKELLAGISHDLATPLTAIRGYASGILDGIASTEEKRRHYLSQIVRTTGTMESLVERLFLFSKLDLGRVEFRLAEVDMAAWLADFLAERRPLYEEKGLRIEVAEEAAAMAHIDSIQLARVVDNVLSNSAKYGAARERIALTAAGGVRLRFDDDGRGVAAEDLGRIFESFYRTDKARSDSAKGSGLGLAIAKKLVEGMGGRIWAEASPLGGLSILVELAAAGNVDETEERHGYQEEGNPHHRG